MRLLVLGGTRFVGRPLVEQALERGHEVTLFHRGQTYPDSFPEAKRVLGDRDGDLDRLEGKWDAVVDICGYVPRVVRAAVEHLRDRVDQYVFVSTVSVYSDRALLNGDENAPVGELEDPTTEEITGETYGPLKVLCEREVERVFPDRALIVRPGFIVGPYDYTDRFSYWPWRIDQGGEVLAPDRPGNPVQFIDVRDLMGWVLDKVENRSTGTFNTTGPGSSLTFGELLEACQRIASSKSQLTWVDESFLLEREVRPSTEMPIWLPESMVGFHTISSAKAQNAGLQYRPLENTLRDALAWVATRPADYEWQNGMKAERERELLAEWRGC